MANHVLFLRVEAESNDSQASSISKDSGDWRGDSEQREAYLIIDINSYNSKQFESFLSLAMCWVSYETKYYVTQTPTFCHPKALAVSS